MAKPTGSAKRKKPETDTNAEGAVPLSHAGTAGTWMSRPMTLGEWAKDGERRRELARALAHPAIQDAVRTLAATYPAGVPAAVTSEVLPTLSAGDLNNLIALRHVHRAGFFGFQTALESLTQDKVLRRAMDVPWGSFIPE